MVAASADDSWLLAFAIVIGTVGLIRILAVIRISFQGERSEPRTEKPKLFNRETYYRIGAFCYSALLGLFGLLTLIRTNDGTLQLLSVTTAIGYAAGIAGRNAGRPWIALWQLSLASLPLALGLALSFEPLKMTLASVIVFFVIAMMDITLQTYNTILRATVATEDNAKLANFHAAMARRDDLTGLANRIAFREQFERWLQSLRTTGGKLAIHWIDLDKFKEVNDLHGHQAGNNLLAGIARNLSTAFGANSVVARLGGDEFAIMSMIGSDEEAIQIGRDILEQIARPVDCGGHYLCVRASVGVAIAPKDGTNADTLLKNADLALYRAKESGRGTTCAYEPAMDAKIERSRQLAAELQGALERQEFTLVFQPIFNLTTRRVISCEALLRWDNRTHGPVSPREFITIAEDCGLIVDIGKWVLLEACRAAHDWPSDVRVAVNLSPIQLRAPDMIPAIKGALAASGIAAERLELEVTESVLLDDIETSLAALDAMNRLNVCTTLDDFGTGYSSLSYLTKFPFQTLKIDRSFVADLEDSPASMAIIQTVVDLATTLGMHTVAEGIETSTQLDQLRRTRCTAAQGYFLARPMSASNVAKMLAENVRQLA